MTSSKTIKKLLIANRGEIAVRIARSAAEMGIQTVGVFSDDEADAGHLHSLDQVFSLHAEGIEAYLNIPRLLDIALEAGCDAVHPGYGFLSENAEFARQCERQGLIFVGPSPDTLALFGDQMRAREPATQCNVPVLAGEGPVSLEQAQAFLAAQGESAAVMLKAVSGGGGKGMRPAHNTEELSRASPRCVSEAQRSFACGDVYIERLVERARHIEVQIIGDGVALSHLWDRDCSLQKNRQKVIEIAPCPNLDEGVRQRIFDAAIRLATQAKYRGVGTFEFLVDLDRLGQGDEIFFLEANPRIQVEHTITEEVLGLDLVAIQLALAAGQSLSDLSLCQNAIPAPRGFAIQARINLAATQTSHSLLERGVSENKVQLDELRLPGGPGIRVDTFTQGGGVCSLGYDPLLFKLIAHHPSADFAMALGRMRRALSEVSTATVHTNQAELRDLLAQNEVEEIRFTTAFVDARHHALRQNTPVECSENIEDSARLNIVAPLQGVLNVYSCEPGQPVREGEL